MATDDISVSIGVKGETQFKKALTECQNAVKQIDSALKANAAEYEANADALGENAEKTQLLKKAIENQKKLFDEMGDAVKYASEKYGESSSQATKYVVAQNKAREAIAKFEKELKDADREMEELGRDSVRVGRQLEQGIGDGADDAAKSLGDMMDEIRDELERISGSVGITATIDVVKNVVDGIKNITEETKEYRQLTSYLEQNTRDAGQNWADIEAHLFRVTAHAGSLEDATEGISNLLAAGLDSTEVADSVNLLLGAVTKFPQTYKFEGLAESLRNTIEEGKAVGQYSELLLALGVNLDVFNEAMEKATTLEARQDLALSFGANRGLEKTISEYEEANRLMLEAEQAMLEYKSNLAGLAEELEPIGTAWTEMTSAVISAVTKLLEDTQVDEWVADKINNIKELAEQIEMLLDEEKREEVAGERIEERKQMIEGGEAESEGEAFLRQMGKPEWYINWYREQAKKNAEEAGREIGGDVVEGTVEELESGGEEMESAISNALTEASAAFGESQPGMTGAARTLAQAISDTFSENLVLPDIKGWLSDWYDKIHREPIGVPPGGNGVNVRETSSAGGATINLNVGGTRFWSAHIDDIDAISGRTIQLT